MLKAVSLKADWCWGLGKPAELDAKGSGKSMSSARSRGGVDRGSSDFYFHSFFFFFE
jgi:hypothetical protein